MSVAGRVVCGADAVGCHGAPAPGAWGAGGWDEPATGRRGLAAARGIYDQGGRAEGDARSCGRPGEAAAVDMYFSHDTPGGAATVVAAPSRGEAPDEAQPSHHVHMCSADPPDGALAAPAEQLSMFVAATGEPGGGDGAAPDGLARICGPLPDGARMAPAPHASPDGVLHERFSGSSATASTAVATRDLPDGVGSRHGVSLGPDGARGASVAGTAAGVATTSDEAEQRGASSASRGSESAWHVQPDGAAGSGWARPGVGSGKLRAPASRWASCPLLPVRYPPHAGMRTPPPHN